MKHTDASTTSARSPAGFVLLRRSLHGGLLGLLWGRRCDLLYGTPEGGMVPAGADFDRRIDELLSLALAVFSSRFGFRHAPSLADLRASREACHG